jgi:hypothetical protein
MPLRLHQCDVLEQGPVAPSRMPSPSRGCLVVANLLGGMSLDS